MIFEGTDACLTWNEMCSLLLLSEQNSSPKLHVPYLGEALTPSDSCCGKQLPSQCTSSGFNSTSPRDTCQCVNLWTVCPKWRCPAETGCVKIILLYSIAGYLGFAYHQILRNRTRFFGSKISSRLQVRDTSPVHWTAGSAEPMANERWLEMIDCL